MREIEKNTYMTIFYEDAHDLLVVKRSAVSYPSTEELERTFQRMSTAVRSVARRGTVMLVDARLAPARNDEEFERAFRRAQAQIATDFSKIAVLVQTAAGRLHALRMGKSLVGQHVPFLDIDEALAYLGVPAAVKRLLPDGKANVLAAPTAGPTEAKVGCSADIAVKCARRAPPWHQVGALRHGHFRRLCACRADPGAQSALPRVLKTTTPVRRRCHEKTE